MDVKVMEEVEVDRANEGLVNEMDTTLECSASHDHLDTLEGEEIEEDIQDENYFSLDEDNKE